MSYPHFTYFQDGDILFSCDPGVGVFYSDVEGVLQDIIYDYNLDNTSNDILYQTSVIWYNDYYLVGNWSPDGGGSKCFLKQALLFRGPAVFFGVLCSQSLFFLLTDYNHISIPTFNH